MFVLCTNEMKLKNILGSWDLNPGPYSPQSVTLTTRPNWTDTKVGKKLVLIEKQSKV